MPLISLRVHEHCSIRQVVVIVDDEARNVSHACN